MRLPPPPPPPPGPILPLRWGPHREPDPPPPPPPPPPPLPSFAYGSTAPPAHVNACHSLSIKRVNSAEVRISASWRSHRRKENLNTATSLPMSTMASTQASSQRTRNVLYESVPSFCSERHFSVLCWWR